jgi:hypothetical protein
VTPRGFAGQRAWVVLPSFAMSKGGRDFQYLPTVELTRELMRDLSECVLAAFEAEQRLAVRP